MYTKIFLGKILLGLTLALAMLGTQSCFYYSGPSRWQGGGGYQESDPHARYEPGQKMCDADGGHCVVCDADNDNCRRTASNNWSWFVW